MPVPYTFANQIGNIALSELDANFANVKAAADTASTVTASSQPAITSVGQLTSLGVLGNISTLLGGVYSPGFYYPNGVSILASISSNEYGNANVAAYLPTYTGNLAGLTGNVTTTADINAAKGVFSGTLAASGNISGTNLATSGEVYASRTITGGNLVSLATITGTTITATAGDITTTGGNVVGLNITTAGNVVASGRLQAPAIISTGTIQGSDLYSTGLVRGANLTISGSGSIADSLSVTDLVFSDSSKFSSAAWTLVENRTYYGVTATLSLSQTPAYYATNYNELLVDIVRSNTYHSTCTIPSSAIAAGYYSVTPDPFSTSGSRGYMRIIGTGNTSVSVSSGYHLDADISLKIYAR